MWRHVPNLSGIPDAPSLSARIISWEREDLEFSATMEYLLSEEWRRFLEIYATILVLNARITDLNSRYNILFPYTWEVSGADGKSNTKADERTRIDNLIVLEKTKKDIELAKLTMIFERFPSLRKIFRHI